MPWRCHPLRGTGATTLGVPTGIVTGSAGPTVLCPWYDSVRATRQTGARPWLASWQAAPMLWSVAFDRLGVVVGDLYFVDPNTDQGAGGAERGVRLELRTFERGAPRGSVYAAVPIAVERPLYRLDLLETVDSEPGSLNHAHHHPSFDGWEPGTRVFDEGLSADPVGWLEAQLSDVEAFLDGIGVDRSELGPGDVSALGDAAPLVVGAVAHLLEEVRAGRTASASTGGDDFVRQGWL